MKLDRIEAKDAEIKRLEETMYGAYLGLCVLRTMCCKVGLVLAEQRSKELIAEIGEAFPSFAARSALRSNQEGSKER